MVSEHAAQVLVASNRGPVSYTLREDGSLDARRGGGGLVSGLSAIGRDGDGASSLWVCAALGDGDREAVRRGAGEPGVRMLDIDAGVHADAYNGIANSVLWFVHHMLYQTPLEPAFDAEFRRQWAAYETYNRAFADALAAEAAPGAVVMVQDYHLCLVPGMLRELRPDLRIGHFSHTPWARRRLLPLLPDDIGAAAAARTAGRGPGGVPDPALGGHLRGVRGDVLGAGALEGTAVGVHGLGADADFLRARSQRQDVEEWLVRLRERVGAGRRTVVRVDRTELSKNIVRGLLAYRRLLTDRPEWRGQVVHIAFAYPSRQDLAVYRDYMASVRRLAEEINAEYGTDDWQPVLLELDDDFARSLAAYRMADVALVNPVRDGMNLVAKEVPVVSDEGCALVLSREAGAYEELGEDAIAVNPYDVMATADALHEALVMDPQERAERTKRLAAAATALPPTAWFLDQLAALASE